MIKFRDPNDKILLLSEAGLLNQYETLNDVENLSQEAIEEIWQGIIKRRKPLKKRLKDRKRSLIQKQNWKKYRTKYLLALRKWHKSISGKRFHRALGRFLATRLFRSESYLPPSERYEFLKLLSSLKTHWYIEGAYYKPLLEEVEYELFTEEVLPLIEEIEKKVLIENRLDKEDVEFLLDIIGEDLFTVKDVLKKMLLFALSNNPANSSCYAQVAKQVYDNPDKYHSHSIALVSCGNNPSITLSQQGEPKVNHALIISGDKSKILFDPLEKSRVAYNYPSISYSNIKGSQCQIIKTIPVSLFLELVRKYDGKVS